MSKDQSLVPMERIAHSILLTVSLARLEQPRERSVAAVDACLDVKARGRLQWCTIAMYICDGGGIMQRTQIYLTEREKGAVRSIAKRLGKTQSDVIRTALDRFIDRESAEGRLDLLRSGRGLWRDREDLPDFGALRRELDRTCAGQS